jgi:hypothetical protein
MNSIMVLHGSMPRVADTADLAALCAALPYRKRLDVESARPGDAAATLFGIALAIEALGRVSDRRVRPGDLRFPQDGKPFIDGTGSFSISHAGDRVGCAVICQGVVGFDLEPRETRASAIETLRWTAVEAVLKAAGAGLIRAHEVELDASLARGRLDGREYWLRELPLHADWIAHVAADAPARVEVSEVGLEAVLAECVASTASATTRIQRRAAGVGT